MKKFVVIFVCLLINVFVLFPTVSANAETSAEEVVSVIRQDFKAGEKGDEFTLEGNYAFSNGLKLKGGKITTVKKARYFICYMQIKSEKFSFYFGEESLHIDLLNGRIEFGENVSSIGRAVEEKETVLWRVEVIDDTLTIGFKDINETVDFIYKNVFEAEYAPTYGKIGISSLAETETVVEDMNIYPYDSNFIPERHDYNETEDATPQREQKPVKGGTNTLTIVLISAGAGVALVAVIVSSVIIVKKRRKKIEK